MELFIHTFANVFTKDPTSSTSPICTIVAEPPSRIVGNRSLYALYTLVFAKEALNDLENRVVEQFVG